MSGVALFVALVLFGLLTGATAGLLGVGGGILIVLSSRSSWTFRSTPPKRRRCSSCSRPPVVATIVLHRRGVGDLWTALRFGVVGAAAGSPALLALQLSGESLRIVFAVFVAGIGLRLIRDAYVMHARRA